MHTHIQVSSHPPTAKGRDPLGMAWDDAAMTRDEAVEYHLRGAVAEADRVLERRRREAPKPPPEPKPPPLDLPTRRFLDDETVSYDLTDW